MTLSSHFFRSDVCIGRKTLKVQSTAMNWIFPRTDLGVCLIGASKKDIFDLLVK